MNLQKFNEKRGITLIALVVTIIVLLILAGVSISMLTGQNGVLNRAGEAKEEYSNSSEKEKIQLSYASAITKKLGNSITAEELQNELDEMLGKNQDGTSKTEITDRGDGVFYVKFIETNHNYKIYNGEVALITGEDKSVVEPKNIADWEYNPNDDGTLTITGYKGSDTEVVIPNYISGVKVKEIKNSASDSIWSDDICDTSESIHYGCAGVDVQKTIKRITISYGIEEIGNYAFFGTVGMNNINIPSTVTNIGNVAFLGCKSLDNINIPSSVASIGWNAFENCSNLTNVTIQSGLTSIGSSAFSGCSSLTNITIPSSVTSIGESAFKKCSSLTNVTIPSSVTNIGNFAFSNCSNLTDITIPSSVTSIGVGAFSGCSSLTNITIPSSVTSIGSGAFAICSSLTNITIPSSVTTMESEIFYRNTFNNSNSTIQIRRKPTKWLGFGME